MSTGKLGRDLAELVGELAQVGAVSRAADPCSASAEIREARLRVCAELRQSHQFVARDFIVAQGQFGGVNELEAGLQGREAVGGNVLRLDLRQLIHASLLVGLQNGHHILRLTLRRLRVSLRLLRGGIQLVDGLFGDRQSLRQRGTDFLKRRVNRAKRGVHLAEFTLNGVHFRDHFVGQVAIQGIVLRQQVFCIFHVVIRVVIVVVHVSHFIGRDRVIVCGGCDGGGGLLGGRDGLGHSLVNQCGQFLLGQCNVVNCRAGRGRGGHGGQHVGVDGGLSQRLRLLRAGHGGVDGVGVAGGLGAHRAGGQQASQGKRGQGDAKSGFHFLCLHFKFFFFQGLLRHRSSGAG